MKVETEQATKGKDRIRKEVVRIVEQKAEQYSDDTSPFMSSDVVHVTEPVAVIFLDYWDKAISPERKVGIVEELPEENRCETLAQITIQLSESGVPVYFFIEKEFKQLITHEALSEELSAREYTLLETEVQNLYKLQTEEP